MRSPGDKLPRVNYSRRQAWVAATFVAATIVGLALVWPAIGVLTAFRPQAALSVDVPLLTRSVGIAALIALLATVLAIPGAWVYRRGGRAAALLLMAPMLLPSYLAYTGWGVLRAPDTALGKWLMMGPKGSGPGDAANWYPTAAGYAIAVLGLALWAWPLAAVIIGIRLKRTDKDTLDTLRLDCRSPTVQWWELASMCRGSLAAAFAILVLIMLGSAVPLHLSQLDTYAVKLWRVLDQTPHAERWKAWTAAWPLVLIAFAGAGALAAKSRGLDSQNLTSGRRGLRGMAGTTAIWSVSVLGPVALLAANVRNWSATPMFLKLLRGPLVASLTVATVVGAMCCGLAVWTWSALSGSGRKWGVALGTALLAAGLLPGVLIGSATVRAWAGTPVGDSLCIVILAHTCRFGFIGVIAGWWLAATEVRVEREMRAMDAGDSARGWWEAAITRQAGGILGAGVGAAFLSLHEIESTVLVQPASSSGGSFAWQMLQWLHFARMDELGVGVLVVVAMGLAAGLAVLSLSKRND